MDGNIKLCFTFRNTIRKEGARTCCMPADSALPVMLSSVESIGVEDGRDEVSSETKAATVDV